MLFVHVTFIGISILAVFSLEWCAYTPAVCLHESWVENSTDKRCQMALRNVWRVCIFMVDRSSLTLHIQHKFVFLVLSSHACESNKLSPVAVRTSSFSLLLLSLTHTLSLFLTLSFTQSLTHSLSLSFSHFLSVLLGLSPRCRVSERGCLRLGKCPETNLWFV